MPPELLTSLAASLTKDNLKGRYVFAKYFINCELIGSVIIVSALKLLYKSSNFLTFEESFPPITILSGLKKSSTAVPSLKNSGLKVRESTSKPTLLHIFSIS